LRISFASKKTISFVLNKVKKFLSLKKWNRLIIRVI
jgi:hypothetical protein